MNDTAVLHIHDASCGECPRCGHPLLDPDACTQVSPPHWRVEDGYDVRENRPLAAAPPTAEVKAEAKPPRFWIVFPGGERLRIMPGETVVLGRDLQPELRDYAHIAGTQASVTVDLDDFYVRDIGTTGTGSLNGTWLNNKRLDHDKDAERVEPNDTLRFADQYIELRREDG